MPYALHFFVIILTAVICEVIYQRIRYNIHQKKKECSYEKEKLLLQLRQRAFS